MNRQTAILKEAGRLIGGTPLLEIIYEFNGREQSIFAKAEYYNLTGSTKDRVALEVLRDAYESEIITPEYIIAEAT
ncbi:MAG: cysteine synthase, partial [Oscillospiraceae bacterium]